MPSRVFENCPCCGSSSDGSGSRSDEGCRGWYCCPATGTVRYLANCAAVTAFGSECGGGLGVQINGPFATQGEAQAACASSSSSAASSSGSGSVDFVDGGPCCDLPATFNAPWEQTAGAGSPNSGTLTFTYDDGTGPSAPYGAGWYSNTLTLPCGDSYSFYYRCVTVGDVSSYKLILHVEPGPLSTELGYTGSGGVWTMNGPLGETCGAELTVTMPYDPDCQYTAADAPLLMAARPMAVQQSPKEPDRFPLPLCKYEGAISEYAGCGCEDKHIRFCELPGQGKDGIPEIDRMTRAYLPNWIMPNCEKCSYKVSPNV